MNKTYDVSIYFNLEDYNLVFIVVVEEIYQMNFNYRIRRLKENLEKYDADAILIIAGPNLRYFSGYTSLSLERLLGLLVFKEYDEYILVIPELEKRKVEEYLKLSNVEIKLYRDYEDPIKILADYLSKKRVRVFGVEGNMPYRFVYKLMKHYHIEETRIIDEILYDLRIIKDDDEFALLKKAAEINMKSMVEGIVNISEGISEKKLMMIIREAALELGAEDTPFTIVQSGSNTSMPHAESSNKKIRRGEIVLLDIGATYEGYVSDITRTVFFGEPDEKHTKIYDIVKKAQEKAIQNVRPGVYAEYIDEIARKSITSEGYGEYFIHRTGHGIGLEVHEEPYIKQGDKTVLRPGMTFTIEPGIYLPDSFGVRIEDNIIVTENGYVDLTTLPKTLDIRIYENYK